LILKGGNDIINKDEIEIRCPGTYTDKYGKKWPCNHMYFVGSPGFDIRGNPKTQTIKCPKCKNYFTITCKIEERVIVKMLATVTRIEE